MALFDVVIIGAGAAGLHCAAHAARNGHKVIVVDHAKQAGKKILISGAVDVTSLTCMPVPKTTFPVTLTFVNRRLVVTPSGTLLV